MDTEIIIAVIVGIAFAVGIFLLLRIFNLWYFKINKRVELLETIVRKLDEIEQKI